MQGLLQRPKRVIPNDGGESVRQQVEKAEILLNDGLPRAEVARHTGLSIRAVEAIRDRIFGGWKRKYFDLKDENRTVAEERDALRLAVADLRSRIARRAR